MIFCKVNVYALSKTILHFHFFSAASYGGYYPSALPSLFPVSRAKDFCKKRIGYFQKSVDAFVGLSFCFSCAFLLCIFWVSLFSRDKPETSFSRRECLEREPRSEGKFFPLKSREDLLRKAWLYPRTSRSF